MARFTHFELTASGDGPEASAPPPHMPEISDLAERLRFSPGTGEIRISDQRLILVNNAAFVSLRRELFQELGPARARALLFQIGHSAGSREARIAWEIRQDRPQIDAFMVGPQLHTLRGEVHVEPVVVRGDVETGEYYSELIWKNSAEAEAHVTAFGGSTEPVCWMQLGYASGYTSVVMDRPILFREIACSACGHSACRIIGKPAEEWEEPAHEGLDRFHVGRQETGEAGPEGDRAPSDVVGSSPGFLAALHLATRVAPFGTTVLLQGETGVGKEIFARAIHRRSPRADKEFYSLNCAAIPETLMETELFGVEKGAYTGAGQSRPGWFETADGATLFLDEIGTLTLSAQAKLLRVLQESSVTRVGSTRARALDVRVICATNEDLEEKCRERQFRSDLLFRLNTFPIRIPPLRERREDLPLLTRHFIERFRARHDHGPSGLTVEAIDALFDHDFPGNVRELENMVERACILCGKDEPLGTFHLFNGRPRRAALPGIPPLLGEREALASGPAADADLASLQARAIEAALIQARGNVSEAARRLGITRSKLRYYLKR